MGTFLGPQRMSVLREGRAGQASLVPAQRRPQAECDELLCLLQVHYNEFIPEFEKQYPEFPREESA